MYALHIGSRIRVFPPFFPPPPPRARKLSFAVYACGAFSSRSSSAHWRGRLIDARDYGRSRERGKTSLRGGIFKFADSYGRSGRASASAFEEEG